MKQAVLPSPKVTNASASFANFNGRWTNELGSTMQLTVLNVGSVTGKYKTAVGSPTANEEFELVGFASGDLLTFTVNFGRYGSLTSWAGQLTEDANGSAIIKTMWLLTENVPDAQEPTKMWGSILAGANNFTR